MKLVQRRYAGVVHADDVAEFPEIGKQSAQVATLPTALEHLDRVQRTVSPTPQQSDVRKARPDPGRGRRTQTPAEIPLLLLQAGEQRKHRSLDAIEQSRELARRQRACVG